MACRSRCGLPSAIGRGRCRRQRASASAVLPMWRNTFAATSPAEAIRPGSWASPAVASNAHLRFEQLASSRGERHRRARRCARGRRAPRRRNAAARRRAPPPRPRARRRSSAVIARLQENGSSSSSAGHGARGAMSMASKPGSAAIRASGILLPEEAVGRRAIAKRGLRLRGRGGMRADATASTHAVGGIARRRGSRRPASPAAREARDDCGGVRVRRAASPVLSIASSHSTTWSRHIEAIADVERRERPRLARARAASASLRGSAAPPASRRSRRCRRRPSACGTRETRRRSARASCGVFSSASKSSTACSTSSRDSIRNCCRNSFMPQPRRAARRTAPAFPGCSGLTT